MNPNVREVVDELDAHGVPHDVDEYEDEMVHIERVTFSSNACECEVLYAFAWDDNGDKVGVSLGWPAYFELCVGGERSIADIDDVLGVIP